MPCGGLVAGVISGRSLQAVRERKMEISTSISDGNVVILPQVLSESARVACYFLPHLRICGCTI